MKFWLRYGLVLLLSTSLSWSAPTSKEQLIKRLQPTFAKQLQKQAILVQWDAPQGIVVKSYNLYWGFSKGKYEHKVLIDEGAETILKGIPTGKVFYFAVTAIGEDGVESDYSNEVRFTGGNILHIANGLKKTSITFEGRPNWNVNLATSTDGVHWRLFRTIKTTGGRFTMDFTNPLYSKNHKQFWAIPQEVTPEVSEEKDFWIIEETPTSSELP